MQFDDSSAADDFWAPRGDEWWAPKERPLNTRQLEGAPVQILTLASGDRVDLEGAWTEPGTGTIYAWDGTRVFSDGSAALPSGDVVLPNGNVVHMDGTMTLPDGTVVRGGSDDAEWLRKVEGILQTGGRVANSIIGVIRAVSGSDQRAAEPVARRMRGQAGAGISGAALLGLGLLGGALYFASSRRKARA